MEDPQPKPSMATDRRTASAMYLRRRGPCDRLHLVHSGRRTSALTGPTTAGVGGSEHRAEGMFNPGPYFDHPSARCSEPPHTGPCRASHTRWYYDPLDRKCFRFTYGGCDANGNNFNDQKTCSETCDGVTKSDVFFRGVFERFDKLEESDSGNIALAVLLSVAILALLVILTYCFLKARKERSHRPVATGPAHVALSEQDTLVYNSTTKPV
ncbi:kunitz-type protease inhibitor 1-like [Larimichthys crocea]|uniref:kunitz-type protease inhibitor 1-like n=1 Tax=Larimichthys crocea TaxID=215358 RepID=UPI000F5E8D80|nr:kunitz-type protease inhibitor 1-like [Larimichthys crocea]